MSNPIITIETNHGGVIKVELYPEIAPNTVNNFISLVQKGFYKRVFYFPIHYYQRDHPDQVCYHRHNHNINIKVHEPLSSSRLGWIIAPAEDASTVQIIIANHGEISFSPGNQ